MIFVFLLGEYGEVRYSLSGEQASLFTIDPLSGVVYVAEGAVIDRESVSDIWLRVVASDNAPTNVRKSTSVPVSSVVEFKIILIQNCRNL